MKKKTIVVLYSDAKRKYFASEEHYKTELEVFDRAKIIENHLVNLGYKALLLPGDYNSLIKLKKINPYLVLNLVDSVYGNEKLISLVPAVLQLSNIPYTGAGISGLSLNASKFLTKTVLKQSGIPVPKFQLFNSHKTRLDRSLNFPLIVKLNESHGSLEIDQGAVVENEGKLKNRIKYLTSKYKQSVIAEEYIRGKEITVLYINSGKKIILAEERIFFKKEKYPLYSYEAAWGEKEIYDCHPFKLNKVLKENIVEAFEILQFKDYARFEIIFDKKGNYYFIDPNANPAFGPYGTTSGPFGYLLHMNNILFDDVLKDIINNARLRFNK